jgi:hypothetical protein
VTTFVPGLEACRSFYSGEVAPRLAADFAGLAHSAAVMGRGSEVLGFDDEMSADHDAEARVTVFLGVPDETRCAEVEEALRRSVPATFGGRATEVSVTTVRDYFRDELALDVDTDLSARDWLSLPEHGLRMYAAGAVFHDDVGLAAVRERLAYYPDDVWRYLLITGWWRVHPELNLVGRTGHVGDELGSALIGSELVTDLMRLGFLVEREYAPYSKWFGTAFARLPSGPELTPLMAAVLRADGWREREEALNAAYVALGELMEARGVTGPATREDVRMWDRPFNVSWADYPELLFAEITDPDVAAVADRWPVGPVDRFRHLLWRPSNRQRLLRVFDDLD